MGDYILAVIESFFKYGVTPTALVMALIYFFRTKHFKRLANRRVPWLFKDDTDVLNYQARQIRIDNKLDRLAEFLGVPEWDVPYSHGKKSLNETNGQEINLLKSLAAYAHAHTIGALTRTNMDSYHSKTREGNIQMKNKLLSRKFLIAILTGVLISLNEALEWGWSQGAIDSIVTVAVGWIAVEGATDVMKKKPVEVMPDDAKTLDSVQQDSEGA